MSSSGPFYVGEFGGADSPEDIVHTHDAVRSGGAAVVHDGGVALHPHPSSVLGQHTVILSGDLTLHQHYREQKQNYLPVFSLTPL